MKIYPLLFGLMIVSAPSFAQEEVINTMPNGDPVPHIYKLEDESVLPESNDVEPLNIELSEDEKSQENSTGIYDIEENKPMPELECSNPNLIRQVKDFIYNNINRVGTNSVVEKRNRILLVKNLHDFEDITGQELSGKDSFSASSVMAHLKINEGKEIYKLCKSSGNLSKEFANLYVVIYPYAKYYNVVVANLVTSTSNIERATFVYNW